MRGAISFCSQDVDLGKLAEGYALLRLPRMPEVKKGRGVEGFVPSSVDPDTGECSGARGVRCPACR